MANQRITMQKLRTLLAFHLAGKSQRLIARQLGIHRRTVSTYLTLLIAYAGGELSALQDFDESSLWQIVTSSGQSATETALASIDLSTLFPDYEKRLSKVGITKRLLWEDYCLNHNGKLSYSRFCRVFLQWERTSKLSLRMEHKAGDKLFIDFAGNKLYLSDSHNDTKIAVEVFVAVLGYSQLTYCQAVYSQRKADFLSALSNSLTFYGGVPQAIVPDNLKSAPRLTVMNRILMKVWLILGNIIRQLFIQLEAIAPKTKPLLRRPLIRSTLVSMLLYQIKYFVLYQLLMRLSPP